MFARKNKQFAETQPRSPEGKHDVAKMRTKAILAGIALGAVSAGTGIAGANALRSIQETNDALVASENTTAVDAAHITGESVSDSVVDKLSQEVYEGDARTNYTETSSTVSHTSDNDKTDLEARYDAKAGTVRIGGSTEFNSQFGPTRKDFTVTYSTDEAVAPGATLSPEDLQAIARRG